MTEKETEQTKEHADIIVEKLRNLFALESRVLEAREQARQIAANHDTAEISDPQDTPIPEPQEMLTALETQLKAQIEEMEKIIDALRSATPSFSTYVLPRMSEIVATLKASDTAAQAELAQLVAALMDTGNTQSLELLEAVIITRLRDNLEKMFDT